MWKMFVGEVRSWIYILKKMNGMTSMPEALPSLTLEESTLMLGDVPMSIDLHLGLQRRHNAVFCGLLPLLDLVLSALTKSFFVRF
jgi:hypothetical protein